jgi:hypothetical protein
MSAPRARPDRIPVTPPLMIPRPTNSRLMLLDKAKRLLEIDDETGSKTERVALTDRLNQLKFNSPDRELFGSPERELFGSPERVILK